jgi:hypothetical protein
MLTCCGTGGANLANAPLCQVSDLRWIEDRSRCLKMTYLKSPVVDLTSRIKPFAQPTGIDMPEAQLPPDEHLVRIDVKDSEGRTASTSFLLKIAP